MHLGGQVLVDLVGDVVVHLDVTVDLPRALHVDVLGGLVVVAELEVNGLRHEPGVVDLLVVVLLGNISGSGQLIGDLDEMLPGHNVPLNAHSNLVVILLGELGGSGGKASDVLVAVVK